MGRLPNLSTIVLKSLGIVVLAVAVLKGRQALTEPVAGNSAWTCGPLLILQVVSEPALGIWLLSGLFRKASWLVGLACFSLLFG